MKWVKKTALLLSLCLSICTLTFAQDDIRKAKKLIELQDFESAIATLNDIIGYSADNQAAYVALGDAYRLTNRLAQSHGAYSSALELGDMANKNYGDVLMSMKDYQGALNQYSFYGTEHYAASQSLIEKCSYAISHSDDIPRFKISEEYINTSKRDFGPAFLGEELVYLSNRNDLEKPQVNSHVNIELLKATKDSKGVLKYPKRIKSLTGLEFNIVSIAYNPALEMVAVTKGGQYGNINLTSDDKCTLYIGKYDANGTIQDLKPYEFNKTDFSTGFASFSEDGQTMYFASDRRGGEGGFDIYMSKVVGGDWSAPMNLGSEVNTNGNEITPAVVGNMLTFASDTRPGFGGYDMFGAYDGGSGFVNAENLGTGINSSFDEYGMIYDAHSNVGYLASTRNQGKGLEDIYRVVSVDPITTNATAPMAKTITQGRSARDYEILKGMAVDIESGMSIANVDVFASADDEATTITSKTNDKGMFSMPLVAGKYYNLKFKSDEYLTSSRTIKMEDSRRMPLMKIAMEGNGQILAQADEPMIRPVALGTSLTKNGKTTSATSSEKETSAFRKPSYSSTKAENTFKAPTEVKAYAIQIAAISKNEKSARFANIKDLGSLYTLFDSRVYKVRCGLFASRDEATEILRRIKIRGYESAFIVEEKPTDSMDLVMMDFNTYETRVPTRTTMPTQPNRTATTYTALTTRVATATAHSAPSTYKVRLATYSNPKWFDQSKVEGAGFGYVEILQKDELSIYLLAGFSSLGEATVAHQKAVSNGFKDAYLVKDENAFYFYF